MLRDDAHGDRRRDPRGRGDKRGSHLALSLERLDALAPAGRSSASACRRRRSRSRRSRASWSARDVDAPAVRARSSTSATSASSTSRIEVPPVAARGGDVERGRGSRSTTGSPQLAREHRTTLVFVNTRRMAERAARHLSERLGDEPVAAHHGSLAKEMPARRRAAAQERRAARCWSPPRRSSSASTSATSTWSASSARRARSRRSCSASAARATSVGGVPKARLFPLSRDELVECAALLDCRAARRARSRCAIPRKPLDVLAQQIVAEVAAREWREDALFALRAPRLALRELDARRLRRRRADARRGLHDAPRPARRVPPPRRRATACCAAARRAADRAHLRRRDSRHRRLRRACSSPPGTLVGTVNEDFAVESLAGDVFQLGNTSYRIRRVESGACASRTRTARRPTIPFWLGEAPGRSDELSAAVSRLRAEIAARCDDVGGDRARRGRAPRRRSESCRRPRGSSSTTSRRRSAALGTLPTQDTIVLERFFDESGGMQLVVHAPFGSRINRAWGLALRKRFCVKFNFELQAAATEDAIVLSLSTSHSFPLADVARYLHSNTVREIARPGGARRADVRDALALERRHLARAAALPGRAARWRRRCSACAPRTCSPRCFPTRSPAPRTSSASARSPIIRWCARRCTTACTRRWTSTAWSACCAASRPVRFRWSRATRRRRRRSRWKSSTRGPTRSSTTRRSRSAARRRCSAAAGWTTMPRRRSAASTSRRSNAFAARRGPRPQRRRDARRAARPGIRRRRRGRPRPGLVGVARGAGAGAPRARVLPLARAAKQAATGALPATHGMWVAAERLPQFDAVHPGAPRSPSIEAPEEFARRDWTREDATRARSCAAASRHWDR